MLVASVNVVPSLDLLSTFTCEINLPAHLLQLRMKFDPK